MSNKFQIMSQAYLAIDAAPIQSFTGGDDEEIWAANNYTRIKQSEMSNYSWNFNIAYSALTVTATTPADKHWTYEYLQPTDILRIISVMDNAGNQVLWETAAGKIYTDTTSINCKYQRDLEEVDFPVYFEDCLIARLAAEASESLSGEERMIIRKWKEYEAKKRVAHRIDGQNNPPRQLITSRNSSLLRIRHGGTDW